jgi:putative transposase
MVITRKLEIRVIADNKEELNTLWKRLRDINYFSYRASNQIITDYHMANMLSLQTRELPKDARREVQANAFQFIYGSQDGYKDGIDNRIYQRAAQNFPELPSVIVSSLARNCKAHYQADMKNGLALGKRSVRNYKIGSPIPCKSVAMKQVRMEDDVFYFTAYGIAFASVGLKKDKSNYSLLAANIENIRDSSIALDGTKLYLLAVLDIENKVHKLNINKVVGVDVGIKCPAVCALNEGYGAKFLGDLSSFKKKIAMNSYYTKKQSNVLVKGGHGRRVVNKLVSTMAGKEQAYSKNLNHKLSRGIVGFALRHNAGIIRMEQLSFSSEKEKFAKLLRYWGYAQLQSMVEYKAKQFGIIVQYVDSHYTSQKCSECGHIASENRKTQGQFLCVQCGHKMNADLNAAINIARSNELSPKAVSDEIK